jgi:formiminotetrahydrofolate cyclodeaminase
MDRFLEELAAPTAVPGGGAAACYAGAMSAAVVEMCAGLGAKKERPGAQEILAPVAELRSQFLRQAELDAAAFEAVMAAYREPKDSPGRKERIAQALKGAALSPLATMDLVLRLSEYIAKAQAVVPASARSDWESAVVFAQAAADVAGRNVAINLDGAADAEELGSALEERRSLLRRQLPEV